MNEWWVYQWDFSVWNLFGCAPLSAGIFVTLMFLKQCEVFWSFFGCATIDTMLHVSLAAVWYIYSFRVSGYSEINKHPLCTSRRDCLLVNFHCFVNVISHKQQLLLSSTTIGTGVWNFDTIFWWQCNVKKDLIHFCCCLIFSELCGPWGSVMKCCLLILILCLVFIWLTLQVVNVTTVSDNSRELNQTWKAQCWHCWKLFLFDKMCSWYLHPNLLKLFSFNFSNPYCTNYELLFSVF